MSALENETALKENVMNVANQLAAAVSGGQTKLAEINRELGGMSVVLNSAGSSALLEARRLVKAAEMRVDELTSALQDKTPGSLARAKKLANSVLVLPVDPINAVCTERAGANVPVASVANRLNALFKIISTTGRQKKAGGFGF